MPFRGKEFREMLSTLYFHVEHFYTFIEVMGMFLNWNDLSMQRKKQILAFILDCLPFIEITSLYHSKARNILPYLQMATYVKEYAFENRCRDEVYHSLLNR